MKKTRLTNQTFDFVFWLFSQEIQTYTFSELERLVFFEIRHKITFANAKFSNGILQKKAVSLTVSQMHVLKEIIHTIISQLDGLYLAVASEIILKNE